MTRCTVSGATGFLGWHVASAFRERGWTVRGLARADSRRPMPAGIEPVRTTYRDQALQDAIADADVVVHLAGVTTARDPDDYRRFNVDLTRHVAEAAAAAGARLVYVSSQAAGGPGSPTRPRVESDSPAPMSAYGASKLEAEAGIKTVAGLDWTILRPCAVYGPRDTSFLPLFTMGRWRVFPRIGSPAFAVTLMHVDDLSRAVERAATRETARGQTLYLGHPASVTTDELLRAVALAVGRSYRPIRIPTVMVRLLATIGGSTVARERLTELAAEGFVCGVEKARDHLGFEASIDVVEGFRRTAAWYQAAGWIR